MVQETMRRSLHDTWIRYEEMFDCLDNAKMALNALTCFPDWLREVQTAIEKMWSKVKNYLRSAEARTEAALIKGIAAALQTITPQDAMNWFACCGYSFI